MNLGSVRGTPRRGSYGVGVTMSQRPGERHFTKARLKRLHSFMYSFIQQLLSVRSPGTVMGVSSE